MKDTDFLFLTSMLRARESVMLSKERIGRMLDAPDFDDAAKATVDCGYPDMSGMNAHQLEDAIQEHRNGIFYEIAAFDYSRQLLDFFRLRYDYHNLKVLVKSKGSDGDFKQILSDSGRVSAETFSEAYLTGDFSDLPKPLAKAMTEAVSVLSRTGNPQLSDIEIDKAYFEELLSLAESFDDGFILDYARLLVESANLRTSVRCARLGRDSGVLLSALIPGGYADMSDIAASFEGNSLDAFTSTELKDAVRLGIDAMKGGAQTKFELACDNAALSYVSNAALVSFGPAVILAYLAKLEWEVTAIRMILVGKLMGISSEVIRERLRDCHV